MVVGTAETTIDDQLTGIQDVYPEEDLLDEYESVGEHSQLVIGDRARSRVINIPSLDNFSPETLHKVSGAVVVDWDKGGSRPTIPAEGVTPAPPYPDVVIHTLGSSRDYILHPGLLPKKRRKRKRSY